MYPKLPPNFKICADGHWLLIRKSGTSAAETQSGANAKGTAISRSLNSFGFPTHPPPHPLNRLLFLNKITQVVQV
jgi:hypothetical protein